MEIARRSDGHLVVQIVGESAAWSDLGDVGLDGHFDARHVVGYLEDGRRLVAVIDRDRVIQAKWWSSETGGWDATWHRPAGGLQFKFDAQDFFVIRRADRGLNLYARRLSGSDQMRISESGVGVSRSWSVAEVEKQTQLLHKYWSPITGDHAYRVGGRDDAGMAAFGYSYEGCEGQVYEGQEDGTTALVRYWNEAAGDHFYTVDPSDAYAFYGYQLEPYSTGFVYRPGSQPSGVTPLYRYWNPSVQDHYYTVTRDDPGMAFFGYAYEKVEAYVLGNPTGGCP